MLLQTLQDSATNEIKAVGIRHEGLYEFLEEIPPSVFLVKIKIMLYSLLLYLSLQKFQSTFYMLDWGVLH